MSSSQRENYLKNSKRQRRENIGNKNYKNNNLSKSEEEIINVGKPDPIIFVSLIILVMLGVIMVFSASYYVAKVKYDDIYYYFTKQARFAILGFMALPIIIKINWNIYKKFSFIFYLISCFFLLLVLAIGIEDNGAKRWLGIGSLTFQPSELGKVGLIMFLAKYLSDDEKILDTWLGFFKCCFIIAIPTCLTGIENTSTAIIMGIIGMCMLFVASPTIIYFIPFVGVGIAGIASIIIWGDAFRMARVQAWLDPFAEEVIKNTGYQIVQSLYAIASGGIFGLGIGQSRQKLGFIPEAQNDIIFSIICEELGVVGASIFIILFAMIIFRGYLLAIHSPKSYMSYTIIGIISMIAVQVIINIAVATNTMPNTGIPLPFISYGGTSLLIMIGCTGLVLNFSRYFK
ncbi:MAG: putative peptidoglycan glycosyltransferase FtsW [bacterium]